MIRYTVLIAVISLVGCTHLPQWANVFEPVTQGQATASPNPDSGPDASAGREGEFNFDWVMQGDTSVLPLQVFDNNQEIWLQFPSGVGAPAIFARVNGHDQVLSYRHSGPYIVLPGLWNHLVVRGGHAQADLRRTVHDTPETVTSEATFSAPEFSAPDSKADSIPVLMEPEVSLVEPAQALVESGPSLVKSIQVYAVGPEDGTMREALTRWSAISGWHFRPEHWAVDVDIPIVGQAEFALPFEDAVRALVAATELGDRPLQPCFYSNQVLRVVSYAQPCNRARATPETS